MKFIQKIKDKYFGGVSKKVADTVAVATLATVATVPAVSYANTPSAPDVSTIVTYISVTAVAAIVAIGGAKFIPQAAVWLYTTVGNMIKRT